MSLDIAEPAYLRCSTWSPESSQGSGSACFVEFYFIFSDFCNANFLIKFIKLPVGNGTKASEMKPKMDMNFCAAMTTDWLLRHTFHGFTQQIKVKRRSETVSVCHLPCAAGRYGKLASILKPLYKSLSPAPLTTCIAHQMPFFSFDTAIEMGHSAPLIPSNNKKNYEFKHALNDSVGRLAQFLRLFVIVGLKFRSTRQFPHLKQSNNTKM